MHIETLLYSNYEYTPMAPSKYVKGLMIRRHDLATMDCPRCKETRGKIEHGETVKCKGCGLHMQVHGNALKIWEAKNV